MVDHRRWRLPWLDGDDDARNGWRGRRRHCWEDRLSDTRLGGCPRDGHSRLGRLRGERDPGLGRLRRERDPGLGWLGGHGDARLRRLDGGRLSCWRGRLKRCRCRGLGGSRGLDGRRRGLCRRRCDDCRGRLIDRRCLLERNRATGDAHPRLAGGRRALSVRAVVQHHRPDAAAVQADQRRGRAREERRAGDRRRVVGQPLRVHRFGSTPRAGADDLGAPLGLANGSKTAPAVANSGSVQPEFWVMARP